MEGICAKSNRYFLMGVSIVAITLCHITQFVEIHKGIHSDLASEFMYASAAVGVDIFFFLSLVGLGFSFEKNGVFSFYKRRINRVFPVYLTFLIICLYCFFRDIIPHDRFVIFLQQISGISATLFVANRVEWYVPSLIILYALYPLAFVLVKWVHKNTKLEVVILLGSILASYLISGIFVGLFSMRLPLYYLAILTYFYIKESNTKKINVLYVIAAGCSFFIQSTLISYALIIPLFLFVFDQIVEKVVLTKTGRLFSWIGKYTLEVYLAQVIATKYLIKLLPTSNVIVIILYVFVTTLVVAYLFHIVQLVFDKTVLYFKTEFEPCSNQKRISWIDAAKGLAMIIIMWGHMQHPSPLKTWLTSFHVPLFLVLTGLLISRTGKVGGGKMLIYKLIKPYVTFSLIAIVFFFGYNFISSSFYTGAMSAVINVYKTITCYGILAIWFIPSYFIAYYAYSKTYKSSTYFQVVYLLMWAFIGIIGSEVCNMLKQTLISHILYETLYYPISAIFRGLACTFYIVMGRLLYSLFVKFGTIERKSIIMMIIGLMSLLLSIHLSQYLKGNNFSLLRLGEMPYMHFVCGTLGSVGIVVFFYLLRNTLRFPILQYIGRKSLILMGTHMSLLLVIYVPILANFIIQEPQDQTVGYYLFGVLCVFLMLIIEIPVIRLFDGKFKFLVSKIK